MSAISAVLSLAGPSDRVVATEDVYGGTYRLFEQVLREYGVRLWYLDFWLEVKISRYQRLTPLDVFVDPGEVGG